MAFIFFFLHKEIAESRVEEELHSLQARGNSHRAILEKHFDAETIAHVVLMESESDTDVVITNKNGTILNASALSKHFKKYVKAPTSTINKDGEILEDHWEKEPYIVTVSPIRAANGQQLGFVYMFQNTASVQTLIQRLNEHFILAGWISIFLTIIIIIFLSKGITKPLIRMKEATSQISKGNFSVSLPKTTDDELGDLAKSIELLAADLNYLKQERNEFLASISHELRTPLTYIKGYADIVLKRELSSEERKKYVQIIVEESNRLSHLIKQLFELAKIDQNSFDIQKTTIHLQTFFSKIEEKLAPAFQEKNIVFEVHCPTHLFLKADPLRLEQIIFNLLDNAIKYSPEGTTTRLEVTEKNNSIEIMIQDNGNGIPEEDLPYIFQRFYRVNKSRTRSLGGTGLGLAIVKELVLAHGGDIYVKSTEQIGTEFKLVFKGVE